MDSETEERLVTIETKLSYLEDFVNKLQQISVEQFRTIEVLETENRLLSGKLRDLADSLETIPNRKPPHY